MVVDAICTVPVCDANASAGVDWCWLTQSTYRFGQVSRRFTTEGIVIKQLPPPG